VSLLYCYRCTLPTQDCVCQQAPHIILDKPWALLVHPREYSKHSNTGRLLKIATGMPSISWHRLKNSQLESQFNNYALLYPSDENSLVINTKETSQEDHQPTHIEGFLIIDATWQESRKMMRQSPWLAKLPRVSLNPTVSQYHLRRNQNDQGLSTLETVSHWLFEHEQRNSAQELLNFLQIFQSAYLKAQQAGLLK